ncbi:hypothetical protein ONZ45_g7569 [Pleurotus djamor]|nr:hypothetical protein ONZ45_g7569 [Pleurotus djamor]
MLISLPYHLRLADQESIPVAEEPSNHDGTSVDIESADNTHTPEEQVYGGGIRGSTVNVDDVNEGALGAG